MKKGKKILLAVGIGIALLAALAVWALPKAQSIQAGRLDGGRYADGTYTGTCNNGIVAVTVEVTVANGSVTDIVILSHRNGLGGPAEAITSEVIEGQTLKVDAIAGATYSGETILKAIENALNSK